MKIKDEIRITFMGRKHLFWLMLINVVVFLFFASIKLLVFLGLPNQALELGNFVELPSDISNLSRYPWTILSYMFVHYNFMHVLFNLLVMYWTGRIFCDFMPQKKLTVIYVLGGLAGGLAFVCLYNSIPTLQLASHHAVLIGASAGVFAIMVGAALMVPDYPVHMLLIGEIKLKYVALALTVLYLISIPDSNSGGNIAHLGGGLAGMIYIWLHKKGVDIGRWIEIILDLPSKLTDRKIRVVHSKPLPLESANRGKSAIRQEIIDAILDKISRSGYDSLTDKEKETLFKASGDAKGSG